MTYNQDLYEDIWEAETVDTMLPEKKELAEQIRLQKLEDAQQLAQVRQQIASIE